MARKKKKDILDNMKFDIIGAAFIFLSIYSYVSMFNKNAGFIGNKINLILLGLFGLGAYLFPIFLIITGIALIYLKSEMKLNMKFYSFCIVFIVFIVFLFLINIDILYKNEIGLFESTLNFYELGQDYIGGGVIGGFFGYSLLKLIGFGGCIVFLAFLLLVSILIFTKTSLSVLINYIKKLNINIKDKVIQSKELKKQDIKNNNEVKVIDNQIDVYEEEQKIKDMDKKIRILDFTRNFDKDFKLNKSDNEVSDQKVIPIQQKKAVEQNKVQNVEIVRDNVVSDYILPDINLLFINKDSKTNNSTKEVMNNVNILNETLKNFGVNASVSQVVKGPTVTRYELQLSPGVKVSKILSLSDDISLSLASQGIRIEAPIPGKSAVGIEVPNKDISTVFLREVIESIDFTDHKSKIAICLGKDVAGSNKIADLSKMPHLLIAGATGSGKSVCINTLIISILYRAKPDEVKFIMIDPKVVELSIYNGIPHLLIPVVTDPKKASAALNWAVNEMSERYKKFAANNVRDITGYNSGIKNIEDRLPQIVVIIDELADLMMVSPGEVEDAICRLAQMARAAGIHLVVATQRPSVDVITGLIKANIPSRISFSVSSQTDSRTILDMGGAEKLLGKGDMLYFPVGESKPLRVQGAYISESEVEKVVTFIRNQMPISYDENIEKELEQEVKISENEVDELLKDAIQIVVETEQASISLLQRRLKIGYNRAARLIDEMEERRIIGEYEGSKPRKVLITKEEFEQMI